jgi:hypothetical protein
MPLFQSDIKSGQRSLSGSLIDFSNAFKESEIIEVCRTAEFDTEESVADSRGKA